MQANYTMSQKVTTYSALLIFLQPPAIFKTKFYSTSTPEHAFGSCFYYLEFANFVRSFYHLCAIY